MSKARPLLLIVDDDPEYLEALKLALGNDFTICTAESLEAAHHRFSASIEIVLLDVRLTNDDGGREGLRLLEAIHELRHVPVVMMTAFADIDVAVEAMKAGATDFVQKSRLQVDEIKRILLNALEKSHLARRVEELEEEIHRLEPWELVGDHRSIQELRQVIEMVATDGYSSVLIRGETGTGKELVARAVHSRGWRKSGPFVAVGLPALSPTLVERELFGNVRGAFTDAREARPGYIQKAAGGVLFLDEIGDLNTDLQPKLLRFLDTRSFTAVGAVTEKSIDAQVVCATNRNLEAAVSAGTFRNDLYYRMRTVEIVIAPLRERLRDIPLLVDHFLFQFRRQGRTHLAGITMAALDCLSTYSFPGNVRELKSIIERAMMITGLHQHAMIDVDDLPKEVATFLGTSTPEPVVVDRGIDIDRELARTELGLMEQALRFTEGRKTDAWRLLGLNDRFALLRRVKRIREAYPELMQAFPAIRSSYGPESNERS
jgi:DNA-binding NtrC family response regulator